MWGGGGGGGGGLCLCNSWKIHSYRIVLHWITTDKGLCLHINFLSVEEDWYLTLHPFYFHDLSNFHYLHKSYNHVQSVWDVRQQGQAIRKAL